MKSLLKEEAPKLKESKLSLLLLDKNTEYASRKITELNSWARSTVTISRHATNSVCLRGFSYYFFGPELMSVPDWLIN